MGMGSVAKYLKGEITDTIAKHDLDESPNFAALSHLDESIIRDHLKTLETHSFIITKPILHSQARVISLTGQGRLALKTGKIEIKPSNSSQKSSSTPIIPLKESPATTKELDTINSLHFFLSHLDKEQAHATICDASKILCVAGAGSGKTTVLTKRIEFLTTYRSIPPEKILAITFTKKARDEMRHRLDKIPQTQGVHIETFNSLCEHLLRRLDPKNAERPLIEFKDKFDLVRLAIQISINSEQRAFDAYFTPQQIKIKAKDELLASLVFDIFSLIEHYKNQELPIDTFYDKITDLKDKSRAKMLHMLCLLVQSLTAQKNLRDYIDQISDTIKLLTKNPEKIPQFTHILVDEFQDTNAMQIKFVDLLAPPNLFCVGDPRQSIYQWRGSKPTYLYEFQTKHENSKIIHLTKNYRSDQHIVELANNIITSMLLPNLISHHPSCEKPQLIECHSEESEWDFVVRDIEQTIQQNNISLHEIFILARTNKQLSAISFYLQLKKIPHQLKTDETRNIHLKENHITLATIHAIKGLEAERVYLIGCTVQYFPCKVSDHPVLDHLASYNTEEEERRLFYVAITRAKKQLILSHASKTPTYFLPKDSIALCATLPMPQAIPSILRYQNITKTPAQTLHILRDWRNAKAEEHKLEKYMILHDRTLQQIATDMPLNSDDLKNITGMGPIKIQKYGEELLSLIKNVN